MTYKDWVRQELRELSRTLSFQYTPDKEIENRLARIRTRMEKEHLEALLVVGKMNSYYLSGTTQDGIIFIPLEGRPLLMIKRELERAKVESPMKEIVALKSSREIPLLVQVIAVSFPSAWAWSWIGSP